DAAEMAVAAACEAWAVPATEVTVSGLRLERLVPVGEDTLLCTTLDEETVRIHVKDPAGPWLLAATARAAITGTASQGAERLPPGTRHAVPAASGRARGPQGPA